MGRFPSGQRGQTVNLLATLSMVRIHLCPYFIAKTMVAKKAVVVVEAGIVEKAVVVTKAGIVEKAVVVTKAGIVEKAVVVTNAVKGR